VDGKLYSMPFNLAGPILYYDKQAFRDAGLDPEKPPATLEEVRAYSEKLTQRDAQGNITHYGIALAISPWIFEQMLAKQGALYVNGDNGRDGRATEAVFDSEQGKAILRWYEEMARDGYGKSFGTDNASAMLAVAQGQAAMAMESTAALGPAVALISISGQDPARLGTGPLPAPASDARGGIVLGGASFWLLRSAPDEEQRGAWEFMKFAASPEQQAQWHADTGYFPSRLSAYDLPAAQERERRFPQFLTAVQQLRDSPDTPATQGALLGPFKNVRGLVTDAFERVLSAGADPNKELESAAKEADGVIKDYNRTAP
jgi:sn-glycerol 3-phosphate transport system substrate-binding protein